MTTPTLAPTAHPVAVQLNTIIEEVSQRFVERRSAVVAIVLAILAKEHVFILGPPGTGKTALTKDIMKRITGAEYFAATLSKSRGAESILGPLDIPALRDNGDLHRKYNGFLPTANYAMPDEVGKMNSTLGHDLLTILLNREMDQVNGGRSQLLCPLYSFFGGSNEIPTEESDDAAALWDRILIRLVVDTIQESANFAAMFTGSIAWDGTETTVAFANLADVVDNIVPAVTIPFDVVEAVLRLRDALRAEDIEPSDRRWKQCERLLQASAFLQGRDQVEQDDIQVLQYALWDSPSQLAVVERAALVVANPSAQAAMKLLDDINAIARGIRELKDTAVEKLAAYGTEANAKMNLILVDVQNARQEAIQLGRSTTKLDEVLDRHKAVKRSIYIECLGVDPSSIK